MNLKNAIEKYLTARSIKLSPGSIKTYGYVLKSFARCVGEDRSLASIGDEEVTSYLLSVKSTHSESTRCNTASGLRNFFSYWSKRGGTNVSPDWIEGPRIPEKVPNFITPEQFALIDDYYRDDEYGELTRKLIFNLLWDTGMRIGELLSLNIADIDRDRNYTFILTEKSKRVRIAVWTEATHELLLTFLGVRLSLNQRPELFQSPRGVGPTMRLTSRSVQRWCRKLSYELGFPINPHAFRHGKMHHIISSGGDRHHVQAIAGHSSIVSSEVYTRLNEHEQFKLQNRFLVQR